MNITITEGQLIWIIGVSFTTIAGVFAAWIAPDKWHYVESWKTEEKVMIGCFLGVGITLILFGLNMDYNWFTVEVIEK